MIVLLYQEDLGKYTLLVGNIFLNISRLCRTLKAAESLVDLPDLACHRPSTRTGSMSPDHQDLLESRTHT